MDLLPSEDNLPNSLFPPKHQLSLCVSWLISLNLLMGFTIQGDSRPSLLHPSTRFCSAGLERRTVRLLGGQESRLCFCEESSYSRDNKSPLLPLLPPPHCLLPQAGSQSHQPQPGAQAECAGSSTSPRNKTPCHRHRGPAAASLTPLSSDLGLHTGPTPSCPPPFLLTHHIPGLGERVFLGQVFPNCPSSASSPRHPVLSP